MIAAIIASLFLSGSCIPVAEPGEAPILIVCDDRDRIVTFPAPDPEVPSSTTPVEPPARSRDETDPPSQPRGVWIV